MVLKLFGSFILSFLLVSCGVETSSSINADGGSTQTTSNYDPVTTIQPDVNTSVENNTTVSDIKSVNNDVDTAFNYANAVEDTHACTTAGGYRIVSDASYDGSSLSENGASGFIVQGQGLVLRSEYMSQNNSSTFVTLFYKAFPTVENLNNQGVTSYKMEDVFFLSYDVAWSDASIPGIDNVMYVQSNKGSTPVCYRLELNSTIGSQIDVTKVYRLRN